MRSIDVKKIGAFVASTAMLGAALAAPVTARMDMTGVTKGFFYDANFNPIVQIVVGEKGMATDAVAAGNIAAAIGNLAYLTKTEKYIPTYEPQGQVVIETTAIGATGDYIQDDNPDEAYDGGDLNATKLFYDDTKGFYFPGESDGKTYARGDFTQYALACDQQTRTEAGVLLEGTYNNIHCLFCKTLCVEGLKNPSHEMAEKIWINTATMRYYEEGLGDDDAEALKLAVGKNAIKYIVETGFIPLSDMKLEGEGAFADFEYRGKIIFMGKEYYVKDIDGKKIYLAEGKVLDDITSEGYTSEFHGYKFKIDHLIYSGEYTVAGILLDVEKPDGTIVQTQISKMANGVVDDLEIAGVYAEAAGAVESASIIVYDLATQVVLEDDKDLTLGGVKYDGWDVEWSDFKGTCDDGPGGLGWDSVDLDDCEIDAYEDVDKDVLGKIEVTYTKELKGKNALEKDESLNFPSQFMLTFKGYMTSNFKEVECSGGDEAILLERGPDVHSLVLSYTASDGNRYDEVRLDEGPFEVGDVFMWEGQPWEFEKTKFDTTSANRSEWTVDVTLKPLISGSKRKITLNKDCDETEDMCGTITVRKIALLDAMKEPVSDGQYKNDEDVELDDADLYMGTYGDFTLIYDDSTDTLVFSEEDDSLLTINPDMVGKVYNFDTDVKLTMELMWECDFQDDVNASSANSECDLNSDSTTGTNINDDDLLVVFRSGDEDEEDVVVDMTDRGYSEDRSVYYKNSVKYYEEFDNTNETDNKAHIVVELDEDVDTTLITPFVGATYTIDWGVDNKIDSVSICHPKKAVDATVFLGIGEEETTIEDTVTKDDEGKTITAGCCTFKVKEFSVNVGSETGKTYTTTTVNKVVGRMVVAEVGADTTKNLIIVGGPVVNGMCTVTKEEIEAEPDKFVVKKDGNLLIVAGYEYEETLNAGDALVEWLYQNIH